MKAKLRSIYQLLDKKIITNVKTPQRLDSFRISTTDIMSENNLPLQVEEIVLDDTEQCHQNTDFIRNLLDDIIKNALGNLKKSSDATKITTCHISEMPTTVLEAGVLRNFAKFTGKHLCQSLFF